MPGPTPSSTLLLDELLEAGEPRLLPELLALTAQKRLPGLVTRLMADPRPFAREVLTGYIDDGCDRPGHRVFVKGVFKAAEKAGDLELMGHFAVSFDRLVRRTLRTFRGWDYQARREVSQTRLVEPKSLFQRLPRWRGALREYRNPITGVTTRAFRPHIPLQPPNRRYERDLKTGSYRRIYEGGGAEGIDPLRFTFSTRRYLQRRTWRFFRTIAKKQSPAAYRAAVLPVLARYRDEHLTTSEALLDAWFLVHALYGTSTVLDRQPLGIVVAKGQSMAALGFAPYCPAAWQDAFEPLLHLALTAQSRPVRRFAIWALETHHAPQLAGVPATRLLPLLKSHHAELQAFGSSLLARATGLETLPISGWLELLSVTNLDALSAICAAVKTHVAPSRLTLEQCVTLACAGAAPVAELGLEWARARPVRSAADVEVLLGLRAAQAPLVRQAGIEWVATLLVLDDSARPLFVRELLDARHVDVRRSAMELMKKDTRFGESFELWLAMSETPYADVREKFLETFEAREHRFAPDTLARVWATTLLSVHRGNRAKRHAANQVADRMVKKPEERAGLVKLLSHTLRSVRATERRAALSALVRAATEDQGLRDLLRTELPELTLLGDEVTE
jgi:hypothetical protein